MEVEWVAMAQGQGVDRECAKQLWGVMAAPGEW